MTPRGIKWRPTKDRAPLPDRLVEIVHRPDSDKRHARTTSTINADFFSELSQSSIEQPKETVSMIDEKEEPEVVVKRPSISVETEISQSAEVAGGALPTGQNPVAEGSISRNDLETEKEEQGGESAPATAIEQILGSSETQVSHQAESMQEQQHEPEQHAHAVQGPMGAQLRLCCIRFRRQDTAVVENISGGDGIRA